MGPLEIPSKGPVYLDASAFIYSVEGNRVAESLFRSLLGANEVQLIAATRSLWEETAHLRAQTGLKTPDALHAASALQAGCTLFVTNDDDFRRVKGLSVTVLKDLLQEDRP